jgi:hypothetical protein
MVMDALSLHVIYSCLSPLSTPSSCFMGLFFPSNYLKWCTCRLTSFPSVKLVQTGQVKVVLYSRSHSIIYDSKIYFPIEEIKVTIVMQGQNSWGLCDVELFLIVIGVYVHGNVGVTSQRTTSLKSIRASALSTTIKQAAVRVSIQAKELKVVTCRIKY